MAKANPVSEPASIHSLGFEQKIEALLQSKPVILQLLRFIAIGVINTSLDFIIFNLVSKYFGITSGSALGLLNVVGFSAAMVQSYFWNRYWTFGNQFTPPLHELMRLILVGGLGATAFLIVLGGARYEVYPLFYLIVLAFFLGIEAMFWLIFNLKQTADSHTTHFLVFVIVSIIGLLINIGFVALVSHYLVNDTAFANADLLKNVAKMIATFASLIWNFIGYKLIVFKNN